MRGSELKPLTVPAMDVSKTRLADVDCPFQHGCEHRLKIAWRATDDLQDFRSGGLLVQRLGQLTRALLLRLEQSHVLDRDEGLVCKGGNQVDLLFREGLNSCFPERNRANRCTMTQQRHGKHCAIV